VGDRAILELVNLKETRVMSKEINTQQLLTNFSSCHVGIVSQLTRLGELPALLAPAELARKVAQDTLDFFKRVVYEHHAEEEKELFPAVVSSAHAGVERIHVETLIRDLTEQHRHIEKLWTSIEPELRHIAKGQGHHLKVDHLNELVKTYYAHARFEEAEFLPLSETILSRNSNHMAALGLSLHLRHPPYVSAYI
jgi:hemerythrin-like domain-containing protein